MIKNWSRLQISAWPEISMRKITIDQKINYVLCLLSGRPLSAYKAKNLLPKAMWYVKIISKKVSILKARLKVNMECHQV